MAEGTWMRISNSKTRKYVTNVNKYANIQLDRDTKMSKKSGGM
jgi:adenosine deaminase